MSTYKIVTVTPAGRVRYLRLLVDYLLRCQDIIEEHHFWVNTTDDTDIQYLKEICAIYPDFFQLRWPTIPVAGNGSIGHFYRMGYNKSDTVYIRLDDDICYIDPNAIANVASHRIRDTAPILVSLNVINNGVLDGARQRIGLLPEQIGLITEECMGSSWRSGVLAEHIHDEFLNALMRNALHSYQSAFETLTLPQNERFSINAISWLGDGWNEICEMIGEDEEADLTEQIPRELGRPNVVCGDALVSHFAYFPQRDYLENNTSLLARYYQAAGIKYSLF